jgi:hypothetical protein
MRRVLAAIVMATAVATPSFAVEYQGYGDTGWNWYDKRDCCEEAVALAQDHSILQCENAGGTAKIRSGSSRGLCDWDARGDGFDRIYRCTASTAVYCR